VYSIYTMLICITGSAVLRVLKMSLSDLAGIESSAYSARLLALALQRFWREGVFHWKVGHGFTGEELPEELITGTTWAPSLLIAFQKPFDDDVRRLPVSTAADWAAAA
jgi:hypothetical protein